MRTALGNCKKERSFCVIGAKKENERYDAKNALILWANSLFAQNEVEALFELVIFLLDSYTSYSKKKIDLHQISTIVDVVNELRNNNSVSHCKENSDFATSIFVRDLGFSLANLLINSLS